MPKWGIIIGVYPWSGRYRDSGTYWGYGLEHAGLGAELLVLDRVVPA